MAAPLGIEKTLSSGAATIARLLRAQGSGAAPVGAPVRIAQDEPKYAIVTEHAADLAEDVDQSGDVLLRRRLETDLAGAALIITQLKIWRAGHDALDGLILQWNSSRVATNDHRLSSCRPRPCAEAPGAFSAPCGRRGACAKTTASDFVTCRDVFSPARREMCAAICLGLREGTPTRGCGGEQGGKKKNRGRSGGSATKREGTKE